MNNIQIFNNAKTELLNSDPLTTKELIIDGNVVEMKCFSSKNGGTKLGSMYFNGVYMNQADIKKAIK